MIIGAHWKVYDRSGKDIDKIEETLHEITQCGVMRTESPTSETNYDATFVVIGNIEAANLDDACEYMCEVDASPI